MYTLHFYMNVISIKSTELLPNMLPHVFFSTPDPTGEIQFQSVSQYHYQAGAVCMCR